MASVAELSSELVLSVSRRSLCDELQGNASTSFRISSRGVGVRKQVWREDASCNRGAS